MNQVLKINFELDSLNFKKINFLRINLIAIFRNLIY